MIVTCKAKDPTTLVVAKAILTPLCMDYAYTMGPVYDKGSSMDINIPNNKVDNAIEFFSKLNPEIEFIKTDKPEMTRITSES